MLRKGENGHSGRDDINSRNVGCKVGGKVRQQE
jgi:hypothetical protein